MATFATIKSRIQEIVLRPLHSSDDTELYKFVINAVIKDLERRWDFGAMESTLELSTTANTEYVALGNTYKKMMPGEEEQGGVFRLSGTEWVRVPMTYNGKLLTLTRLRRLYADPAETDEPSRCCVHGRRLYFGPTPDDAYSIRVPALVYLAEVSDTGTTTNWFTETLDDILVIEGAGLASMILNEPSGAAQWLGVSERSLETAIAVDASEKMSRVGPRSAQARGEMA